MQRILCAGAVALALAVLHCSSDDAAADRGGACMLSDQDGVIGGDFAFDVAVSDTAFTPVILKAQNSGTVRLKVTNTGSKPHGFAIDCLVASGCTACLPDAAKVGPLAPGETRTTTFVVPEQEGIYAIRSGVPGDSFAAQLVLQ